MKAPIGVRVWHGMAESELHVEDRRIVSVEQAFREYLACRNGLMRAASALSKAQKEQVLGWMSAFDAYNTGVTGLGHCN